jgi:serine phosphatase RsbU (regulator of sigma subunit)
MAAAIHMLQVQTILRNSAYNHNSPKEILISMNRNLKRVLPKGSFFTVCISSISKDGVIQVARAGHQPLLYYKRSEDSFLSITPKGIGLGITGNDMFEKNIEEICIQPESEDILILYTDGVTEARDNYKNEFGEENLKLIIRNNSDKSPEEIKYAVLENISLFKNNTPAHDDLTFVILKAK